LIPIESHLLSCTVSKLWLIIGKIFSIARGEGVPHFNALARGDSLPIIPISP